MSRPRMIFQGLNKTYDGDDNNPDGKRLSSCIGNKARRIPELAPPAKYIRNARSALYTRKTTKRLSKNYATYNNMK